MRTILTTILMMLIVVPFSAQSVEVFDFEVKGLCVEAPVKEDVDAFINLIDEQLAPGGLNTLILRVDWNYEYKKRPELVDNHPLSEADVKKLVNACKKHNIRLIPQVNLLGHQSWAGKIHKLLEVYPEFDETPSIQLPEKFEWPNPDGYYCKSYCPQHPDVHAVVFDIMDEIVEVFESDAFHAGMDEVFYISHDDCERCRGTDPAVIYANEITKLRNHLAEKSTELWIWGDRFIDGKATGIGLWEGSYNNTHRAIDWIPKDVVINDWHYEIAHPTPVLFAAKGLSVTACPWNKPEVAINQLTMMKMLKSNASPEMKTKYKGILHTFWGPARMLLAGMNETHEMAANDGSVKTLKILLEKW